MVQQVKNEVKVADSLLVLGTSLNTFSGYRIILQAVDAKKPIAIVSIGETRGDNHANIKIQGRCGEVLSKIYGNRQKNVSWQHEYWIIFFFLVKKKLKQTTCFKVVYCVIILKFI